MQAATTAARLRRVAAVALSGVRGRELRARRARATVRSWAAIAHSAWTSRSRAAARGTKDERTPLLVPEVRRHGDGRSPGCAAATSVRGSVDRVGVRAVRARREKRRAGPSCDRPDGEPASVGGRREVEHATALGARGEDGDVAPAVSGMSTDLLAARGGGACGRDAARAWAACGVPSRARVAGRARSDLVRGIGRGANGRGEPTIHGGCCGKEPSTKLAGAPREGARAASKGSLDEKLSGSEG